MARTITGNVTLHPAVAMESDAQRRSARLAEQFQVDELLGEGGMGRVFVAHDRSLGRTVAIKQLRAELVQDKDALYRFVLEAQVGAQLTHPNILPLYSFERAEDGSPAFAMQLVDGHTLADYAKEASAAAPQDRGAGRPFAQKERIGTLLGVCDAVHFAHQRGVVHRDLKPENIMVGHHRDIYLMDWGIAHVMGNTQVSQVGPRTATTESKADVETATTLYASSASGPSPTQPGQIMGTPQYMAPEQALGDPSQLGPATDQFALGMILAELATLRPARAAGSLTQALVLAAQGAVSLSEDIDGHAIDPGLRAIIHRATAVSPADRYPSVDAMADDIRRFVRDEPVSVYRESIAKRAIRVAARRPAASVALISAVLLIFACAAIVNLIRSERQAERHAAEVEITKRVLVAAGDRAHIVDVWFSDISADLAELGAATVNALAQPQTNQGNLPSRPPALHDSPHHGAPVSFEQPVVHWIGKVNDPRPPATATQLLSLAPWLQLSLASGLPVHEQNASDQARASAVAAGHSTLLRSFVGIEADGSFAQYPAREMPSDYDVRTRPWYREARTSHLRVWSRPTLSLDGTTLRISALQPLRSEAKLLAVVGVDLRVPDVAERLKLDVPGFRRAYLALPDGRIAVRNDLEKKFVGAGISADAVLELPGVESAALAKAIAEHRDGGLLREGSRLIAFARMVSPPWTYVAEFDAEP